MQCCRMTRDLSLFCTSPIRNFQSSVDVFSYEMCAHCPDEDVEVLCSNPESFRSFVIYKQLLYIALNLKAFITSIEDGPE